LFLFQPNTLPANPEQSIGEKEKKQTEEGGKQVKEVEVANGEVDTDRTSESRTTHHGNDLDEASGELGTACHEQQQATDRAQSATEARAIVGDDGDERVGDLAQGAHVETNEPEVGRNKDRGHAEDRNGSPSQNQACCARA
jgi:hypothetical protein